MAFHHARETLDALIDAYFGKRKSEMVLSCVTDDVEWVGTEKNENARGKAALKQLLEAEFAERPDAISVELEEPKLQPIGSDGMMFTVMGKQHFMAKGAADFPIRGTACCIRTAEGWLVANAHLSAPNAEVEKLSLQTELSMEREKRTSLLENIPGGVTTFRLKKDGHIYIEYISDGLAKLCGYTNGKAYLDAIAENQDKVVQPDDFRMIEEACRRIARNGGKDSVTYRVYDNKGEILWLQLDFVAMTQIPLTEDDEAVFYGVQTLLSQETLRAKTEREYYRTILNLTKTAYFELDAENHFYFSDSFRDYKVSQYGLSAIMGDENARKCFHPDDLEAVKAYLHHVHLKGDGPSSIVRMLMTDGSYQWTELTAHVEFSEQHIIRRMTGILRKVNAEWEKQKETLSLALEEAKKANQAKTNFLSRVSHDMRTPLNGILGITALLKDSITDQAALQDLSELEISGKYLLDLINDTLDMSRIETGNLELHPIVCDGRMMFNNAIRMARLSIKGRNITFHLHTQKTPFTLLYVDVSRVEQIFMNVFGNAVKFTPDGGTIDFSMINLSVEKNVITNKLVISDTGIGMSPEFLPHIFEPFSQADASKTSTSQGTGLGMAITKQLIELMGGSISVESELGKGSSFTLILKLHMANAEQIAEWKQTEIVSKGNADLEGRQVLLCEDHPLNTQIATRLLEAKGVTVEHAENGQVGVELFRQSALGYYDAVLMDIRMPVMDGIEAAKAIRKLDRADAQSVPIIAMTANAFAEDVAQTRAAGMNGHLSKPIQANVLFGALAEQIRASQLK